MKSLFKTFSLVLIFFCWGALGLSAQILGDVNHDQNINILDALMVAQYAAGLNPAGFYLANADTNCDAKVDILDALLVARYSAALITKFPCTTIGPTPTPTGNVIFQDNFNSYTNGQIITDDSTYDWADFPGGGTSGPGNPSTLWETDTSKFVADQGWGFSGKPNEWSDRYFFRPNTRYFKVGNAEITWRYKSAPFGQDGFSVEGADAVDVWLRYQTQYNLYTLQFDRTNNVVVVKRKVPAEGWTGPSGQISNRGVYYTLFTDAEQPIFGAGEQAISWSAYNLPNLAHDSSTVYRFKARVTNKGSNVQIQLWRDDKLIGSWLDQSDGTAANGQRLSAHLAAGYYNSVKGWQASWGQPITLPGATGFRADNIKCWFDDFVVIALP